MKLVKNILGVNFLVASMINFTWANSSCQDVFEKSEILVVAKIDFKIPEGPKADIEKWISSVRPTIENYEKNTFNSTDGYALAPMGGTKIRAFRELGLRGLMILDMNPPGDAQLMKTAFKDSKFLTDSLKNGIFGGMDTMMVRHSSPIAQILAKLSIELGVSESKVQFFRTSSLATSPDVVKIQFLWEGEPREILYVQKMLENNSSEQVSLLHDFLEKLKPSGFRYLYVSADGLALFNADPVGSGLEKTSKELLSSISNGGGVLLDYPLDRKGEAQQIWHRYHMLRSDLTTIGLEKIATFYPNANFPIYGYSLKPYEEVRLYAKPIGKKLGQSTENGFFTRQLEQIGETLKIQFN